MMAGLKENDELLEGYKHLIKKVEVPTFKCLQYSLAGGQVHNIVTQCWTFE